MRFLLPYLAPVALFSCLWFPEPSSGSEPPNIVMIVVDDLGYGDLGCYGSKEVHSPNIDSLVGRGIRFTNGYANCPVCSPTRASLLTGRYPELAGVPGVIRTHTANNWGYLNPDAVVLPKLLKTAGYQTGIVGKWHLGLEPENRPTARGFDFFHGFLGDMMDDYYHHRRHNINYMRRNESEIHPSGHATDLFTQWAVQFINEQAKRDQRFFLYLAYNAPHTPIQPPEPWIAKVRKRQPGLSDRRAKLVALIEHMDEGIGKVINSLEQNKISKKTLVLFVSDNGGQINVGADNGPLRDGKQSMYEGGIRVPMSVTWPDQIKPNRESSARVISMDVLPTLCEILDIDCPEKTDGRSFLPILDGKTKQMPERDLFFHRREGGDRYGGMITYALIQDDWKLVRDSPYRPLELFNLKNDPQEKVDLAITNRKKFRELSIRMRAHLQRGGKIPWQKPD